MNGLADQWIIIVTFKGKYKIWLKSAKYNSNHTNGGQASSSKILLWNSAVNVIASAYKIIDFTNLAREKYGMFLKRQFMGLSNNRILI